MLGMQLFFLICIGLYLYTLIDILKCEFTNSIDKLVWLIAVIFLPILGIVLYFFIGRKQKIQK
jgi:phosphotransferase system  glucose/maltose/N-acetylglucosamine-specific IIC component